MGGELNIELVLINMQIITKASKYLGAYINVLTLATCIHSFDIILRNITV